MCSVRPFVRRITSPPPFRAAEDESPKAATRPAEGCSVHTARPNIDNVDNMDTTARRVEATQARGGEYRKSKRPPPTNRERPKPQIKNERPKKQRARLCTNIQHEAKRYTPPIRPPPSRRIGLLIRFQTICHNVDTLQPRRAAVQIVHRAKHSTPRKVFPTNQTRALFCPSENR